MNGSEINPCTARLVSEAGILNGNRGNPTIALESFRAVAGGAYPRMSINYWRERLQNWGRLWTAEVHQAVTLKAALFESRPF